MLRFANKWRVGRHLPPHVVDRRLPSFAAFDAVPKSSVSRWSRVYEDFVGSQRLIRLQNQIAEVENECLRSQNVRFECQQRLTAQQNSLKDLHSKLQEESTTSKTFPALFSEELRILKEVRATAYDFHLYEELERETFLRLEGVLSENRREELRKAQRSHRFLLYACLVGLTVGILGTLTSFYLHNYLFQDPTTLGRTRSLRQLAVELAAAIESRNVIIRAFLQDLAVILGTSYGVFIPQGSLVLPSAYDKFADASSPFRNLVTVFTKYNHENGAEMNRLRLLLQHQRSQEPHVYVVPSVQQDDKMETDIGPLWRTTFVYSMLIVAVPVVYSLLA